ncbi:MAG TPA: glycosyltransferase [Chloroflexota bacterium]|nr:glycosyltransferase [Chloroflexota bacterium]
MGTRKARERTQPDQTVVMLLLGDVTGDGRVIKTARAIQHTGRQVTLYCCAPDRSSRPLPDLEGASVRWVTARRPLSRLIELARRLRQIGRARTGVRATSTGGKPRPAVPAGPAGPRVLRELRAFLGTLRLNLVMARAVREPGRVIHAHDLDTLLAGVLLRRRFRARLVYDAHELYPEMLATVSPLYAGAWRLLEHWLIRRADAVITVNQSIAVELQRRHHLAVLPTVVMNCPPVEQQPPASPAGAQEPIALLYHGGFQQGRGLEELVQAMAHVDDRATLLLRGSGPLHEELERLARAAGVERRVRFLPPVSPDQLVAAMAGCTIGIVPYLPTSLNNYLCTPNKLFDYMMGGLAVVATDLPELRRVVQEWHAGLVYQPDDACGIADSINGLIGDPRRLAQCRAAARRAALERFNWEAQSAQLVQVYAGLAMTR